MDGERVRKIIHVDMDAFFASVEQRDNPALRGRPVAVGGSSRRGVVAAASYEARAFGVRSAMPSVTAARACPDLIFVKPRFDAYAAVSAEIRAIFARYADAVEPLSLDEAYCDVTQDREQLGSATATARAMRADILQRTGLTASAGVSYNKFIAKLASDQNKPDGLTVVPPRRGPAFVASLPVSRFHGVGPVTAARLGRLGIHTGAQLREVPLSQLERHFGSHAERLFQLSRGIDDRPVRSHRVRKSVGAERTFHDDLWAEPDIDAALRHIATAVWARIAEKRLDGRAMLARTVTLKLRWSDFDTITRARSIAGRITHPDQIVAIGRELIAPFVPPERGIRLLGLSLRNFAGEDDDGHADDAASRGDVPPDPQRSLFD